MRAYRYGGVEPSALDPSPEELLRSLADDLAYHGDVANALAELLQRGLGDAPGIAELLERLRRRRDELLSRYDPRQTLSHLRKELDEIVASERRARERARSNTDDPAHTLALLELDALPHDLAERIGALESYSFLDSSSKERFDALLEQLRSSLLARSFDELAGALEQGGAGAYASMLAELADLVERWAQGEDVSADVDRFREAHPGIIAPGESFEDFLARLSAARLDLERLLASVDEETRWAFERLAAAIAGAPEVQAAMERLSRALSQLAMPQVSPLGFRGTQALSLGDLSGVVGELGRLDALEEALRQAASPERLGAVDLEEVRDLLGDDAAAALARLARTTEVLEAAGLINRVGGRTTLSPRAIWRLGDLLLRELFGPSALGALGQHVARRRGRGLEANGEIRPLSFGDPFRLALPETLRNATLRSGPGMPIRLAADDFVIEEVDDQNRQGTVLALDLSLSMPLNDTFLPAKRVALALAALVRSRFPADDFSVVVFSETAREVPIERLPEAQWDYVYGTNIAHAIALARARLRRVRGRRQLLLVTDGEPTAHVDDHGEVFFSYPPTRETVRRTLAEVVRATKERIEISVFVLARDHGLRRFVEQVVTINHGHAYYPGDGEIGRVLLNEFLGSRLGGAER